MRWRKLGRIYAPQGDKWWARSYALLPTADVLDEVTIRVYFASLDSERFGRIGYVDLNAADPKRILCETPEPVLDIGELGSFDDSGVNPSCLVNVGGRKYLYYIGWQRSERVPYLLFSGLAISDNVGDKFDRLGHIPVLERSSNEPCIRSSPSILIVAGAFKLWYVSGLSWIDWNGTKYPRYVIRYAESSDGIYWKPTADICINFKNDDEFGFGRPWVVKKGNGYSMWYSIRARSKPYCLGYAESDDGIRWTRKDEEVGLSRSATGWDSEMICYPCVVDAAGTRYMFYNGNRHGSTGFGCAVLENGG